MSDLGVGDGLAHAGRLSDGGAEPQPSLAGQGRDPLGPQLCRELAEHARQAPGRHDRHAVGDHPSPWDLGSVDGHDRHHDHVGAAARTDPARGGSASVSCGLAARLAGPRLRSPAVTPRGRTRAGSGSSSRPELAVTIVNPWHPSQRLPGRRRLHHAGRRRRGGAGAGHLPLRRCRRRVEWAPWQPQQ
jgi:hypothetical protein